MSIVYSLIFENQSRDSGSACVFQTQSDDRSRSLPVMWFTKAVAPGTRVHFAWRESYSFVRARSLSIEETASLPAEGLTVGIGTLGSPILAMQAVPGEAVEPIPAYWVAFGMWTEGQVLDVHAISNPVAVPFAPDAPAMTVIYRNDGTWIVHPTHDMTNSQTRKGPNDGT